MELDTRTSRETYSGKRSNQTSGFQQDDFIPCHIWQCLEFFCFVLFPVITEGGTDATRRHLEDRDQGRCETSYSVQDGPPQRKICPQMCAEPRLTNPKLDTFG